MNLGLLVCKMVILRVVMRIKWEIISKMLSPGVAQRNSHLFLPLPHHAESKAKWKDNAQMTLLGAS